MREELNAFLDEAGRQLEAISERVKSLFDDPGDQERAFQAEEQVREIREAACEYQVEALSQGARILERALSGLGSGRIEATTDLALCLEQGFEWLQQAAVTLRVSDPGAELPPSQWIGLLEELCASNGADAKAQSRDESPGEDRESLSEAASAQSQDAPDDDAQQDRPQENAEEPQPQEEQDSVSARTDSEAGADEIPSPAADADVSEGDEARGASMTAEDGQSAPQEPVSSQESEPPASDEEPHFPSEELAVNPEPEPTLDDLAAALVQLEPSDDAETTRIRSGLERLAGAFEGSATARDLLFKAADKLKRVTKSQSSAVRDSLLSEAGLFIDAASDMMEAAPESEPIEFPQDEAIEFPQGESVETPQSEALESPQDEAISEDQATNEPRPEPQEEAEPVAQPLSLGELLSHLEDLDASDQEALAKVQASIAAEAARPDHSVEVQDMLAQAGSKASLLAQGSLEDPAGLVAELSLCLDAALEVIESAAGLPFEDAFPLEDSSHDADSPGAEPLSAESAAEAAGYSPDDEEQHSEDGDESVLTLPDDTDPILLGEFITESNEAIDAAEAALLTLESNSSDMEAVNTVFRAFHTLKGTSAFLGLDLVSRLAHHAENLLSRIRDGEIVCSGGYADLALRSVDMLKELLASTKRTLDGEHVGLPAGYQQLRTDLSDPEGNSVSQESVTTDPPKPRLGDILVNQGKVERQKLEEIAEGGGDEPLGVKLVKSSAASVSDVAHALRAQKKSERSNDPTVRVRTERLDRLIDLVGELVIAQSMVSQDEMILNRDNHDTARKVNHAGKIVRELQDLSMSMRMVPLKATFQKMARLVRDLARKSGKQVDFLTEGEDTEIDRNMVDVIGDPLVHMVRNAADHGIEPPEDRATAGKDPTGCIRLSAYHSGGNVVVELKDDGRGLDRSKIAAKAVSKGLIETDVGMADHEVFDLIFAPGFSTAEKVTDVSGRGVGMDVVKRNVESLRGRTAVRAQKGEGTTFSIVLPLTLAITDGMLIRVGSERFIIPTVNIYMSFRPEASQLSSVSGKGEMVLLRDELMPVFRLYRLFEVDDPQSDPTQAILVIVGDGERRCAIMVDELLGQQQVVAKSLGEGIGQVEGISGGAILGDGRVGLIIDTAGLASLARHLPCGEEDASLTAA